MAKQQFRLKAGQVVTRDRSKPVLDADGKPVPGRFERKVIKPGGIVESDRDLAAAEPSRYEYVSGPSDAARVRQLERELAEARARLAQSAVAAPAGEASVFPGGQVSSGFQATTGGVPGPLSPEDAARLAAQAAEPGKAPEPKGRDLEAEYGSFEQMTLADLRALAEAEGIHLHGATRKEDVVRTLRSAR